ncbi:protein toll-like [Saccostrea echinata]|uniref:protein toll-like n=1 Tax=Saccostrea echinata TaxID=191078 RepID=UPI002A819550|nr:protein toll-like [Saccostrea echinata]
MNFPVYLIFLLFHNINKLTSSHKTEREFLGKKLGKLHVTESNSLHTLILNTSSQKYLSLRMKGIFDRYMSPWYCVLGTPGRLPDPVSVHHSLAIMITCEIEKENIWSFKSFRLMVKEISELTGIDIGLSLSCSGNGTVSLPWPMRANNVRYLVVEACFIVDHYTEAYEYKIDEMPDTIEYFKMTDCVIINDRNYFEYLLKSSAFLLTRASLCGPENAKVYAYINIIQTFYGSKSLPLEEFDNLAKLYTKNLTVMAANTVSCQYKNLIVYDRSRNGNLGATFFENFIGNSYPNLEILNFSNTGLRNIPPYFRHWRLHFPKLKILDMSYNHINDLSTIIDFDPGSANKGVINLQHNNLTGLSNYQLEDFFRKHTSFYLDMRNNPFSCGCEMLAAKNVLLNTSIPMLKHKPGYSYLKGLKCSSPKLVSGRKLITLTDVELGCETEIKVFQSGPIIILCVLVFLLLVCLIIIIRYRVEIKILAFTRFNIVFPCQQQDFSENKKFDAFVAYSQHDSEWVLKNLVWQLETKLQKHEQKFQLCLHQRDFTVGAPIAENIIDSIERSRHTILVISTNFVRSEWCLMEFRTAFHQSLIEKRRHMILVVMGDLPHGELDSDIKRCLKTITYLETHDRLFWDKLVYALSDKQRVKRRSRGHRGMTLSQSNFLSSQKY